MNSKFTWISLYNELSNWLLLQMNNQSILKEIGITGFRDGSERGVEIELEEMDPFTFFSYLNKFHSDERQIIKNLSTPVRVMNGERFSMHDFLIGLNHRNRIYSIMQNG